MRKRRLGQPTCNSRHVATAARTAAGLEPHYVVTTADGTHRFGPYAELLDALHVLRYRGGRGDQVRSSSGSVIAFRAKTYARTEREQIEECNAAQPERETD